MRIITIVTTILAAILIQPVLAMAQGGEARSFQATAFISRNAGGTWFGDTGGNATATYGYGAAFGFAGNRAVSAEADFNYNSQFFGREGELPANSVLTLTFDAILGLWIGGKGQLVRPVIGAGLIRSCHKGLCR